MHADKIAMWLEAATRQTARERTVNDGGLLRLESVAIDEESGAPSTLMPIEVAPGRAVALHGPPGCGKTTVLLAAGGLSDEQGQRALFDGVDVRCLPPEVYERVFGIVWQSTWLFAPTVAENIAFGRPISREKVSAAARLVGADDFIRELPAGYDTEIGGTAIRLSGGQRRLVALARALAGDPRVLLLDEPTSGLEGAAAARVWRMFAHLSTSKTVLCATHEQGRFPAVKIFLRRRERSNEQASAEWREERPSNADDATAVHPA